MRGRVAVDLKSLGILGGQNLQLSIGFKRTGQVEEFSIDARDDCVGGQARADGVCHIDRPAVWWDGLLTAIGQSDSQTAHCLRVKFERIRATKPELTNERLRLWRC